jgi:hypothetical protein
MNQSPSADSAVRDPAEAAASQSSEGEKGKADQAEQSTATVSSATVNYSAASWIENRHRFISIRQHRF